MLGSAGCGLHLQRPHLIAEGKLKAVAERASVAGVIAALAACPGRGPSVARVAGQAVEFVCKYYKVRANFVFIFVFIFVACHLQSKR